MFQVNQTSGGQFPYAVVLSCIDSRVPVEVTFDQGIGDIFSARVAGNIINEDILGSIEYACGVAGSKQSWFWVTPNVGQLPQLVRELSLEILQPY